MLLVHSCFFSDTPKNGRGSTIKVEGNGSIKNKQTVTDIFVSVQQQY